MFSDVFVHWQQLLQGYSLLQSYTLLTLYTHTHIQIEIKHYAIIITVTKKKTDPAEPKQLYYSRQQ